MARKRKLKDYTGRVFGVWTVKKFLELRDDGRQMYSCVDLFGAEHIFSSKRFTYKSFGKHFLNSESVKKSSLISTVMSHIIERCYNCNCKHYKDYGGRGIRVCDEWLGRGGRRRFVLWAIQNGWKSSLTIDRIDNSKGYSPENCRFVTLKKNNQNRRSTILNQEIVNELRVQFTDSILSKYAFSVKEAKKLKVNYMTVYRALNNHTWN